MHSQRAGGLRTGRRIARVVIVVRGGHRDGLLTGRGLREGDVPVSVGSTVTEHAEAGVFGFKVRIAIVPAMADAEDHFACSGHAVFTQPLPVSLPGAPQSSHVRALSSSASRMAASISSVDVDM